MTLHEFIHQIPSEILRRGQNYYDHGHLLNLTRDGDGSYHAEVEGSQGIYTVNLQMDVGNNHCSCPYDGLICKHIAAVAIAIDQKNTMIISSEEESVKKNSEETWEQLIQQTDPENLRQFMCDFGLKNQDFRHQVKLAFSNPILVENAVNIPYYQSQINGIFENYGDNGFIDYRGGRKAMNDVSYFLRKLDDYYSKGNLSEVFSIAAAIAMECVKAIQNIDDSSGECGGTIHDSFEAIENALNDTNSSELKTQIFDWLFEQVQNTDYKDYGLGDNLEPLFFKTAKSLKKSEIAYQFIDDRIRGFDQTDGWSKKYYSEFYLAQKVDLLQSEGRTAEAEDIIDAYLHFDKFRQMRVAKALSENDIKKAEALILKGVEIAHQENFLGSAHQWKDQLMELYHQQNESLKYKELARELFKENPSSIKYFIAFKKSNHSKDWEEQRNRLITELKSKDKGYHRSVSLDNLAQVYIEELMVNELFELVSSSSNIHTIIKYTDHLQAEYPTELLGYYKSAIEKEAIHTGRNVYTSLANYLETMSKLKGGKPIAMELKAALLDKYKNRPAMREEFERLNWK